IGGSHQDLEVEIPADDRGSCEQTGPTFGEPGDALSDHLPYLAWHQGRVRLPGLLEMTDELFDEERVAPRLVMDPGGQIAIDPCLDQGPDIVRLQGVYFAPDGGTTPLKIDEGLRQEAVGRDLRVAVDA